MGSFGKNGPPYMKRLWFTNGHMLIPFDTTPDRNANDVACISPRRKGTSRLDLRFEEALTSTIKLILYAEFDNEILIDFNRQVTTDIV